MGGTLDPMDETSPPDQSIEDIAVLAEPVRRSLYRFVSSQGDGAGREAASEAVGVSRALAAFHLDRLVKAGLLEATYRHLGERRGPGAGRPSKIYRRAAREVTVSLPERRYELAGQLLAAALDHPVDGGTPDGATDTPRDADGLSAAARELGLSIGDEARRRAGPHAGSRRLINAASAVLGERGYEPVASLDGSLILRNCPFDALAKRHRTLICGMNFSIMGGVLEGLRARGIHALLDPQPGRCCVVWRRDPDA